MLFITALKLGILCLLVTCCYWVILYPKFLGKKTIPLHIDLLDNFRLCIRSNRWWQKSWFCVIGFWVLCSQKVLWLWFDPTCDLNSYITSASLTWALCLIVFFFYKRTCLNWLRSAPCLVGWRMRESGGRSEDVLLHNWIPFSSLRITNQVSHYFCTAITKLGQWYVNMWICQCRFTLLPIYQYMQNYQPPNYKWVFPIGPCYLDCC